MLTIPVDPDKVQGEQLATELAALGHPTTVRLIDGRPDGPAVFELADLDAPHRQVVLDAIKAHRPDREFGWSPEVKARAAAARDRKGRIAATLGKPNPSPVELRDALADLARHVGLLD